MNVYLSRYHIILVILTLVFCVMFKGCTTAPSGAFEDLPEEYIFKVWGYRIVDAIGTEHTYRTKVDIPHQRKGKKWCTIHRCPEEIKAHFDPKGNGYFYWVNKKKR